MGLWFRLCGTYIVQRGGVVVQFRVLLSAVVFDFARAGQAVRLNLMELYWWFKITCSTRARNMPINPSREFLIHAADCKRMARFTHDSENELAWTRMAERWQQCAEWFKSQALAADHHPIARHRPRQFRFAHR
jgi:hypothetical protein